MNTQPTLSDSNRAWFTGGALRIQRCGACDTAQHPPEELCHACGSMELTTRDVAPTGTVVSFTVVHHPPHPALAAAVPYTIILVSPDDEPDLRIVGNLDADAGRARIGLRVVAFWEEWTVEDETILVPQWRPA